MTNIERMQKTVADGYYERLMDMARRGPAWVGHVRHEARELERHERLYGWRWYTDVRKRVEEALKAENLIPKEHSYESPSEDGAKRADVLAGDVQQQSQDRDSGRAVWDRSRHEAVLRESRERNKKHDRR